jgi:hypothetical protein
MKIMFAILLISFCTVSAFATETSHRFDDVKAGETLKGWEIAATGPHGPLAEWKIIEDATAPSSPNILSITNIETVELKNKICTKTFLKSTLKEKLAHSS